ncbi:hypothetical protein [Aureibacillus halotolerans]|uniref:Uncharacterized protein n=1 Tax=Aureibacillus halotolerans TaxID=1508390 RepID=A0A4R6U8Y3_9BACI|nr:hypothetical protein [Aureibacillus halotolerans]TDQ43038.1 hypothetical protein EV213_101470 [Aureibacillus halotolerans]
MKFHSWKEQLGIVSAQANKDIKFVRRALKDIELVNNKYPELITEVEEDWERITTLAHLFIDSVDDFNKLYSDALDLIDTVCVRNGYADPEDIEEVQKLEVKYEMVLYGRYKYQIETFINLENVYESISEKTQRTSLISRKKLKNLLVFLDAQLQPRAKIALFESIATFEKDINGQFITRKRGSLSLNQLKSHKQNIYFEALRKRVNPLLRN